MNPLSHDATMNPNPTSSPPKYDLSSSQILSRQRPLSPSSSIASLPYRPGRSAAANPNISNLFASTSSLPGSNFSSGSNTPTAGGTGIAASVFSSGGSTLQNGVASPGSGHGAGPLALGKDEPRSSILQAFVPHVAILTSPDVDELMEEKGFGNEEGPGSAFLQLVKPFGERMQGRVTIRNSVGASTTWDDFGVRFVALGEGVGFASSRRSQEGVNGNIGREGSKRGGDVAVVEELVDRHLEWAEMMGPSSSNGQADYLDHEHGEKADDETTPKLAPVGNTYAQPTSPFYTLYLRRILSALPIAPHETFSYPVACCIVISSRNPNPIGELKELYHNTNTGDAQLPGWMSNEYLRYYVLVHDEDRDDIGKSTQMYEQMRRSFGLHCHLLRLRSIPCLPSDDDAVRLPSSEWSSAGEELAEIQQREILDTDPSPVPTIPDSDTSSLRTFIRELVAQSIIPSMERSTAHWNDQVAARRRGIGGRLMSLGKRFAFGSSSSSSTSRNSSSPVQGVAGGSGNYDALSGTYRPESPEAVMRRLGDYAFMLRDFKLAHSTYDLVRGDFENDKAWQHWAGANEMTALSSLLHSVSGGTGERISRKSREEGVDKLLESAVHTYIHRSPVSTPFYALRTLLLSIELLKIRGGSAIDDAARWGGRVIESGLVGDVGAALVKERIGVCYASRRGVGGSGSKGSVGYYRQWGTRRRKAGLWTVMAADAFLGMGKTVQAEKCLKEARRLYGLDVEDEGRGDVAGALSSFQGMREFLDQLRQAIVAARLQQARAYDENGGQGADEFIGGDHDEKDGLSLTFEQDDVDVEEVVAEVMDTRPHRRSIVANTGLDPLGVMAMTEPLSPVRLRAENPLDSKDDGFS